MAEHELERDEEREDSLLFEIIDMRRWAACKREFESAVKADKVQDLDLENPMMVDLMRAEFQLQKALRGVS